MNWDVIQGKWTQLKGKAKEEWGDIRDDEWDEMEGKREKMSGKLQERYGWAKDEADKKLDDWAARHNRDLD